MGDDKLTSNLSCVSLRQFLFEYLRHERVIFSVVGGVSENVLSAIFEPFCEQDSLIVLSIETRPLFTGLRFGVTQFDRLRGERSALLHALGHGDVPPPKKNQRQRI